MFLFPSHVQESVAQKANKTPAQDPNYITRVINGKNTLVPAHLADPVAAAQDYIAKRGCDNAMPNIFEFENTQTVFHDSTIKGVVLSLSAEAVNNGWNWTQFWNNFISSMQSSGVFEQYSQLASADGPMIAGDLIGIVIIGGVALYNLWNVYNQIQQSPQESTEPSSPSAIPDGEVPENAKDIFGQYEKNGWVGNVAGQTPGTKAGGEYENQDGRLPETDADGNEITYREFDVDNKVEGEARSSRRFVHGSDGSTYYTDNHYGSFTRVG